MNLRDMKVLYAASFAVLGLIILLPILAFLIKMPLSEQFTTFSILGPTHSASFPSDISENDTYRLYLNLYNRRGDLEYYRIYVKIRNETDPLPHDKNGAPSSLKPCYTYATFLNDGQVWEREIAFSISGTSFGENTTLISTIAFDGHQMNLDKTVEWDSKDLGFYFQLIFELWRFNAGNSQFEYTNQYTRLPLNMTADM